MRRLTFALALLGLALTGGKASAASENAWWWATGNSNATVTVGFWSWTVGAVHTYVVHACVETASNFQTCKDSAPVTATFYPNQGWEFAATVFLDCTSADTKGTVGIIDQTTGQTLFNTYYGAGTAPFTPQGC